MSFETYDDAVAVLAACNQCHREHEERVLRESNVRQTGWADPVDGHPYQPRMRDAADILRQARRAADTEETTSA